MSERIQPVARMTVTVCRRGKGRPQQQRTSGLRERAWWLMRQHPRFTLDDLLFTLNDSGAKDAPGNLTKYIAGLEAVGVLVRLQRRAPGRAPTSNGHVIWRLARDLGRQAPVWRAKQRALWDPNSSTLIAAAPAPAAAAPAVGEAQP
jgi:hypothetical protein